MKILCRHESMASHYIYRGLGLAFDNLGHEFMFWNPKEKCAFDIFNEYKPDIFLGQGYNLDRAQIKCINNNPDLICLMKVGMWGDINEEFDHTKYEALFSSPTEALSIDAINKKDRLFLFNYGHKDYHDLLIKKWKNITNTFMLQLAADKYNFYPDKQEKLSSDLCFVGGYWPYKGQNINKYILPLCNTVDKYRIKIGGNQLWPVPQYIGYVDDVLTRQLISSAKISIAVHEPHANKYGYEEESRIYNALACGTLVISDNVESYKKSFGDDLLMFDNPIEYRDSIDYFLDPSNKDEKITKLNKLQQTVIKHHTYDSRVKNILRMIG